MGAKKKKEPSILEHKGGSERMRKRIMAVLLAVCVMAGAAPCVEADVQAEEMDTYVGLDAEYHTQDEIKEYYKNHPIKNMEAEFVTEPSVTAPYALGELTEEAKQDALNALNFYRYIAGVPLVSITEEAQSYAQAAALVSAINRNLQHHPDRPEGMEDAMFSQAFHGAAHSNLTSIDNILSHSMLGCMLEVNGSPTFGHRRKLLDYYNTEAGFGMVKSFSAIFVDANLTEDKAISYPGQNQPLEFFAPAYAWTVIIPERVDESAVNISVSNVKTGEEWNFNKSAKNLRLAASTKGTCAIFAPSTDYREGDQYKVEITGIAKPISYEVNMFWAGDPVPLESIAFSTETISFTEGRTSTGLRVKYTPENASNQVVTWTSSNPDVAEPLRTGTGMCDVIAKKPGTTVFTATSDEGGHTAEITVEVIPKPASVVLNETELTIGVGQSFILTGTTLPEESNDRLSFYTGENDYDGNIISISAGSYGNGKKITGKALGETSITAYASYNKDATAVCKIRVVEPVDITDLYFKETEIELMVGDVFPLNLVAEPENTTCRGFDWVLSPSAIAGLKDGVVTAEKRGEAKIKVKALDGSGKEAQCTVKVYEKYEKADAPELDYALTHAIALKKVWGYEYSMDLENWQNLPEFTNLEPGHAYTFYARKQDSDRYYFKAGDPSEGVVFWTKEEEACLHTDTEIRNVIQASCLEGGYSGDTYCKNCGAKLSEGEDTKAEGHLYVGEVTKEPTVTEEGVKTYTCAKCQDSYTESIKKLPSSDVTAENISGAVVTLSKGICNYTGKAQEPRVKMVKLGQQILDPDIDYTVIYQNNVNIGTASVIITGKGHYTGSVTKNFSITAKKGSRFAAGAYKYQITGASEAAFAGLSSAKTAKVAIPKTVKIGGRIFKVTSVAKNALKKTKIISVSIGDNVKVIGVSAFEGCAKLGKATLGKGVTEIGGSAFKNCDKLRTITIKSTKLRKVGKNALKGVKPAAKIKVPASKLPAYKKLFKNKGKVKF